MRQQVGIRRFQLLRKTDVTGISGTGLVAVGAQLPTGRVVLEWRPPTVSLTLHENIENVVKIHCHAGATELHWFDGREGCEICGGWGTDVSHNCPCECLGDNGATWR